MVFFAKNCRFEDHENRGFQVKICSFSHEICQKPHAFFFQQDELLPVEYSSLSYERLIIGFLKFMIGYGGMCMIGGKFLKGCQVRDKIIESFFPNLHSTIYK